MRTARWLTHAALAAVALAAAAPAPAPAADTRFDPRGIATPPLRQVRTVTPARFTLPNGVTVFLLEDHTLPVVRGTLYVPASPTLVPAGRTGLDDIAGEVMRSGGTARTPGDALDDRLAAIGASVSTSLSSELGYAGFRCLAENTAEVVAAFADVARRPLFPEDKVELAKVGLRRQIAGRNDEMVPVLMRIARQAVFGKDSPWARLAEYATIEPITREDCAALHAKVFVPERAVLAVYGDFRSADMRRLLTAAFGDWKRSGTPAPALPPEPAPPASRLVFAPKEDVTQAGLVLAQPGHRADDPDYAAMQVFEQALGGGFASRLFNRIRTERGLAYAAGATAGADFRRPGVFSAYTLTRSDSAMSTLALLRDEVAKGVVGPFTEPEFRVARDAVQNAFVFNFEEPSAALFRAAYYQVSGYPLDFLDRYQRALGAVTPVTMQEAARRKVRPEAFVVAVVGKERDFDRPLESAGLAVERVDISIPPPPSKVGAGQAGPEALAKGRAWLDRAAAAAGGRAAWGAIRAVSMEQTLQVSIQGQSLEMTASMLWAFPDRQVSTQKLPMMEMRQGFDGTTGWMAAMGQVQEQPRAAAQMKEEWERSLFRLFGAAGDLPVQALPEARTVDGVRHDVALVASEHVRDLVLFFAPDGRLARMEYQGEGPQGGPAAVAVTYADWQASGPIQYPRRMTMTVDGKPFIQGALTSITLDPPVPADAFQKPQP
jgi:zinc protease